MSTKKLPDYGFSRGIEIDVNNFPMNGHASGGGRLRVSPEELSAVLKAGSDPESDAKVAEAMSSPRIIRGIGGVGLEVAVLNTGADSVMGVSYGWGGNVRHPVAVNEAKALAAQYPDKELIFMNPFGTGRSDNLPRSAAKDLRRTGHYSGGFGEIVGSVYDEVAEGRPIHLRGHSLGARTVFGATPYMGKSPETVIVNDPTGTRKMSLAGIALGFVVKEGRHLGRYLEAGFDQDVTELQKNPVASSIWDTKDGTKGGWRQQFLVDPSGLSKDGFGHDLLVAAPNVQRLIRVISPELSALNNPEDIYRIMKACRDEVSPVALLEQYILRDHTHSVVTIPQVLTRLYAE